MQEEYNEMLYDEREIYEDRDHQAHVQEFYRYVGGKVGYGSVEWIEICKY